MDPWLVFLGGAVTVAGSVFGARYASRASIKVKEIDVDAAAYERADKINAAAFQRLEGEVERQGRELADLRTAVKQINKVFQTALNFIEQFLLWERNPEAPLPHIPEPLKEHLDPRLVAEHIRQQANDENRRIQ